MAALIGQAMMMAGAVLLVLALVSVLPRALRVRRRARALAAAVDATRLDAVAVLDGLRARRAETEALLVPLVRARRMLRWARHPLVVATIDWYRRRRRVRHARG